MEKSFKIRHAVCLILAAFVFVCSFGCTKEQNYFNTKSLTDNGYQTEEVHVSIKGCKKKYHFLWVSDLHLVVENDQIAEDQIENVRNRRDNMFVSPNGERSVDFWANGMPKALNDTGADAIIFGADIVDFCSDGTIPLLKCGMDQITLPFMYIRADHDSSPFWMSEEEQDEKKAAALQDSVCEDPEIWVMEYDEFIILGVNRNTYQMTKEGLKEAKKAFAIGKPVIIAAHVPYVSEVDPSLQQLSRDFRGDRELMWGPESTYVPDEVTGEFFDMIYADESPVVAIFSGHLHTMWDGKVTDKTTEHVFTPAFQKSVGIITVDGEE